jgi:hypothetical protein
MPGRDWAQYQATTTTHMRLKVNTFSLSDPWVSSLTIIESSFENKFCAETKIQTLLNNQTIKQTMIIVPTIPYPNTLSSFAGHKRRTFGACNVAG